MRAISWFVSTSACRSILLRLIFIKLFSNEHFSGEKDSGKVLIIIIILFLIIINKITVNITVNVTFEFSVHLTCRAAKTGVSGHCRLSSDSEEIIRFQLLLSVLFAEQILLSSRLHRKSVIKTQ